MATSERGKFRISLRALMIGIAIIALLTAPFVWLARRAQREMAMAQASRDMAVLAEMRARDARQRAEYVAQIQPAQAALGIGRKIGAGDAKIDEQGNDDSRTEVEKLRLENERLRRKVKELERANNPERPDERPEAKGFAES